MMGSKKAKGGDRLPVPMDDPEYSAAHSEHDRLRAKLGAAGSRVADLERRIAEFGAVDSNTPAERAAVVRLASEDDADPAVKELATTLAALEPLERELAEARAEVALREKATTAAERKVDALWSAVRGRQCAAHTEAVIDPLRGKVVAALGDALALMRQAAATMTEAGRHFGVKFERFPEIEDGAKVVAKVLNLIEHGPPEPPPDVTLQRVIESRAEDERRREEFVQKAREWNKTHGEPYPFMN